MTDDTDPDLPSADDASDEAVEAALIEVAPGAALVFGNTPPGVEILPIELLSPVEMTSISSTLNAATGVLNLGAQGASGLMQARGLVRLAPETLKALQTARPLTDGTYNLGVLVGQNGKFAAQVRWMPAAGAQTAGVAATLGPALALLAIQAQLNQITGLVQENIELTSAVLKAYRVEKWSEIHGLDAAVRQALDEAQHAGAVSDKIWDNVKGKESELRAARRYFTEQVTEHSRELARKERHTERRDYLRTHGAAIVGDVHGMLTAQSAWYAYQALRAGNAHLTAATDPNDAKLLEKIARDAPAEHRAVLDSVSNLVDDLLREANILAELDGKWTFPFGKQKRAAGDVAAMATALREALDGLRDGLSRPVKEPLSTPQTTAFPPGKELPDKLLKVLRWHLAENEALIVLADARLQGWRFDSGYVAVTDRRLLLMKRDDIIDKGLLNHEVLLSDVRYVRYTRASRNDPPSISVFTPAEDLQLDFGSWAKSGTDQAAIDELAQILTDAMNMPEPEKVITVSEAARGTGREESKALTAEEFADAKQRLLDS